MADDFYDESNDNNLRKFLRSMFEEIQSWRDAIEQVRIGRRLNNPATVGAQLDMIGRIIKQPRLGLSDDNYRRMLNAKVLALRSSGTKEDIIAICVAVINDNAAVVRVINWHTEEATAQITGVVLAYPIAKILISLLRVAIGAGKRIVLTFVPSTATPRFRFKPFSGSANPDSGFRRVDGTHGGHLDAALG